MKIYLASSWRNQHHSDVLKEIRAHGFDVYDFKSNISFHWRDIDPDWVAWSPDEMLSALDHELPNEAFRNDFSAMEDCDICVLLLPCGKSAHLEAGWFVGKGRKVVMLTDSGDPELMAKMFNEIVTSMSELIETLGIWEGEITSQSLELQS